MKSSWARKHKAAGMAAVFLAATAVSACIHDEPAPQVAGWAVSDPSLRHPIKVSHRQADLAIRVTDDANGLSPHQRDELLDFLTYFRAVDAGNSKLVIEVPGGGSNETSSIRAVTEIKQLMRESGFSEASIAIEPYHAGRQRTPPIRVAYRRYFAEAPSCGQWPSNLADDGSNNGYENFGCATQANLAAMVSNPADLTGPRNPTPRSSERRDRVWENYVKGDSTISRKQQDERVDTGK